MTEEKFKSVDNIVLGVKINNVSILTADGEFQARKPNGDMASYYRVTAELLTQTVGTVDYIMTYQIEWHAKEKKYVMYQPDWNVWSYDLADLLMQCYSWDRDYANSFKSLVDSKTK